MTRWKIEKSGTGIEKSGTGIEKSGTGIEKSGTGIEKSGTGIRKFALACSLASLAFTAQADMNDFRPEGSLNVVIHNNALLVSWIIDGSIFSGVSTLSGASVNLSLTEVSLANNSQFLNTTGGGTGTETTGGGTGTETTGGGTGSKAETTGGGTGSSTETTGGGTGTETTGGGTGTETTGGGTGTETTGGGTGTETTGGGTGIIVLTTGGGTGSENIAITLPASTGLEMEITLNCQTASVSVLDLNYVEVVSFKNIAVIGDTGLCQSGGHEIGPGYITSPHDR